MLKFPFNSLSKIGVVKAYFILSMNLYNIKLNILLVNSSIHAFLLHHKFSISQNFDGICVKIVKQYVYIKFMGFKV